VKTRFAIVFAGLLLVSGMILLGLNFLLVRGALPGHASQNSADQATAPAESVDLGGPRAAGGSSSEVVQRNIEQYRADTLNTLLVQSGIALAATAVLALGLGWVAAHRLLRPVHRVTATARQLGADSLDERIRMPGPRDELTELADTFDEMLDRLAGSFDSQRRFVANASHELRTPLATQRTMVEVAMAKMAADAPARRLCERLLKVNARSEELIDGLLVLASSDRGLRDRTDVRLDEVVAQAALQHRVSAGEQGITLGTELVPRTVRGDRLLLDRLVTNLIDNAIKYNRPGGSVRIRVAAEPALTVTNTGPAVPADAIPALFEPFRQLREDRTGRGHGVGLGLSIVRAHSGTVHAAPGEDGGLSVTIGFEAVDGHIRELPRSRYPAPSRTD
jgi:signal transduction histidine kinase